MGKTIVMMLFAAMSGTAAERSWRFVCGKK
jgi:hypothetical protein